MKNNKICTINIKNFKQYFKLFILIFSSIVGVGFVSGSEIVQFFTKYGQFAYIGAGLFFILVYVITSRILLEINGLKVKSKSRKNTKIKKCKNENLKCKNLKKNCREMVTFLNVFVISGAMFSGLKHLLKELYNNNFLIMYLIFILVIFIVLYFGVEWLVKIDIFVLLFTLFIVFSLLFQILKIDCYDWVDLVGNIKGGITNNIKNNLNGNENIVVFSKNLCFSLLFSILYVFMNFFQLKPIIQESKIQFESKKKCCIFALIFSAILTIILCVFIRFLTKFNEFSVYKMPFLQFFSFKNSILKWVFSIGLIVCLSTTLISCLIGLKRYYKKFILAKSNLKLSFVVYSISLIFGLIDFSFFVQIAYPFLGVINLIAFIIFL